MAKQSKRQLAKLQRISHTTLNNHMRFADEARRRGVGEQFNKRVRAGEKTTTVVADLMPDVGYDDKLKIPHMCHNEAPPGPPL